MTDIKKSLLDEAESIINGNRRQAYGEPEQNFERIARLWNAHLLNLGVITDYSPRLCGWDVPIMMDLMKIARLAETPNHRDSIVDLIGYAACYGELVLAKEQTLKEYTNEAIDDIVAGSNALYNKRLEEVVARGDASGVTWTKETPIVPKRDVPAYERAKMGDTVMANGTPLVTGTVTDIDYFDPSMRLQIDGEWVANDRIVAIL